MLYRRGCRIIGVRDGRIGIAVGCGVTLAAKLQYGVKLPFTSHLPCVLIGEWATLAQLAEHRIRNAGVKGSTPFAGFFGSVPAIRSGGPTGQVKAGLPFVRGPLSVVLCF